MKLPHIFQKTTLLLPAIAMVAILLGLLGAQLLGNTSSPNGSTCKGICVNITENGIEPNELAVKVGEFVQFNSADGKSHILSTGSSSGEDHGHSNPEVISSGEFGADEAWRVQFKTPGTYKLVDTKNAEQNILVVVY